jgi:pyruvate/2-oxoglutarate dehydrogenase complex dihydrolipoamide acyltransferase (E2) component
MKVTFTHDDRVVDALYAGRALELFRSLVENPERLEQPPEPAAA